MVIQGNISLTHIANAASFFYSPAAVSTLSSRHL